MDENKVQLTPEENRLLNKVKTQLLNHAHGNKQAYLKNHRKLIEVAEKYNVDAQVIWDSIE